MRFARLRQFFGHKTQHSLRRRPARFRPRLEHLEERLVPATLDVGATETYTTISAAVAAAHPGDTILVDPGTYAEKVTVNVNNLTIEGANAGINPVTGTRGSESIVTGVGNNGYTPFYVSANDDTIDGFTVEGATSSNVFGYGIDLGAATHGSHILNNIVTDNLVGIGLANNSSTDQSVIQNNLIENNNASGPGSGTGIYSDQYVSGKLQNVLITGNSFVGNATAGIGFSSTDDTKPATEITISNNIFNGNGQGMYAFNLTSSSITDNTFESSTESGQGWGDIELLEGSSGVSITCNVMRNGAGYALEINNYFTGAPAATGVTFTDNSITGYAGVDGVVVSIDAPTDYSGTLNATDNWWGSSSGPAAGSIYGNVNYTPWLLNPAGSNSSSILLLDRTGKDSLNASGYGNIAVTDGGSILVDSTNSEDALASDNAQVSAASIQVAGVPGTKTTGNGTFNGSVTMAAPQVMDPLASLANPPRSAVVATNLSIGGNTVVTLQPGTYVGGLQVSGQAVVYLEPGIYTFEGGGLTVSGHAKVLMASDAASHPNVQTGIGVLLYNAPNGRVPAGPITISDEGLVRLQAPTLGIWQGISLFQARSSTAPITLYDYGRLILNGTLYAPNATINVTNNGNLVLMTKSMPLGGPCPSTGSNLIAFDLDVSGDGKVTLEAT